MVKKISKREKFVIGALFLSLGLFISQYLDFQGRIILVLALSFLSVLILFLILYQDIKATFRGPLFVLFILPLLYPLSFGFFYFLLPERFLTRIILTTFFGVGLYALYLSANIFAVTGARTIQLLNAARSVSFLLTVLVHFFLTNVVFSLRVIPPLTFTLLFLLNFILILPSFWSINLEEKITKPILSFAFFLALVISELALALNFWPATPTVVSLFLSGNFYAFVGLSQAWLERRLFKNTLLEYLWVAIIVFLVLLTRTKWGG